MRRTRLGLARARVVPVCYWSGGSLNTDPSLVSTVFLLSTLLTLTHLQLSPASPADGKTAVRNVDS